jgi:membrane-bound metal-dependent hydrolase YbcI (DUF457 family)
MHRRGHVGITLLAFAPIAYLLLRKGSLILAVIGWLSVHAIEPWPDQDFWIPGLRHRGTSHSVSAALFVGSVLGLAGWLVSGHLLDILFVMEPVVSAGLDLLTTRFDALLGRLPAPIGQTMTEIVAPLTHELSRYRGQQMNSSDRWSVALFGFLAGVYGIVVHLLGDVITTNGIRPFLPFSSYQLSLSPLRAANPTVNEGLFLLGILAMGLAVVLAVPSVEVIVP